jgi:rod shape-determining protein MreB
MKQQFSLRIGEQTAEHMKIQVGSAFPLDQELSMEVNGLDTISGVPRKAVVTSEEVREALHAPIEAIIACVKTVIEQCKPELVADLADNGLVLTGGGALLRGLDLLMNEQLGIPVRVADSPLLTVARGTAICLEHLAQWRDSLDSGDDDV